MKITKCWPTVCLIFILGYVCGVHADTGIDGSASTSSSFTLTGPVFMSSMTVTSATITTGYLKINSVPYSWPSSQGANSTYPQNNGSGTLAWTSHGLLLQTVSTNTTTSTSVSTSTYTSTTLQGSITTTVVNSQVVISGFANVRGFNLTNTTAILCGIQLRRGSTILYTDDRGFGLNSQIQNQDGWQTMPVFAVDTPGVVGTYSYTVYLANSGTGTCILQDLSTSYSAFSILEFGP